MIFKYFFKIKFHVKNIFILNRVRDYLNLLNRSQIYAIKYGESCACDFTC